MILVELRIGIPIRCSHASGIESGHPPIVVATDVQVVTHHQQIANLAWPERARHAIAEVDGAIDIPTLDVSQDRFECGQVPMYVGYDGDAHNANG